MTDMTLEQMAAKIRSHADFVGSLGGSGELMDSVELSDIADAIDAHLAKAADYERVVTEQAMLTECVSVTARDPSDVILDVIQWHVSNAAQPVKAIRATDSVPPRWYTLLEIEQCLQRMSYSDAVIAELAPWFFRHIKSAFDKGYSVAVERAALAHPRPTGDVVDALVRRLGFEGLEALAGWKTRWSGNGNNFEECLRNGHLLTEFHEWLGLSAPTVEQAGEVAWIDHTPSGVVLRTTGECKRLEDLPHGTKLYAQPRPVGVPDGEVG